MREGHASKTAEYNALFRALEAALPVRKRLFDDPLAGSFLRWPLTLVAQLAVLPGLRELFPWIIDTRWPGVRTSVTARTRLIDEVIAASLAEPFEQFVLLGAGFDTRAYRLPVLRDLEIFEVDHPDTLAIRQKAVERMLHDAPRRIRFVAIDFKTSDLASVMAAAGYRESARTFFLWEGVTNYLTEEAVDTTLRWCARAFPGSKLLFTYVHRDILTRPSAFVGTTELFAALDKAGERFTFGIDPSELREFLARRGLVLESDIGCAEYRQRYYGDAARHMRGHEFYRVALAHVAPRATAPET